MTDLRVAELQQEWLQLQQRLDDLLGGAWDDLTQVAVHERQFAINAVRSQINALAQVVDYASADELAERIAKEEQ